MSVTESFPLYLIVLLPFLGAAERYRYFEMPLVGLLGFIPFGIECWVMWQLIRIPLDGLAEGDRVIHSVIVGCRPSPIVSGGAVRTPRPRTCSTQPRGISVAGSIRVPPASASRCVQIRGTHRTTPYPPPP